MIKMFKLKLMIIIIMEKFTMKIILNGEVLFITHLMN